MIKVLINGTPIYKLCFSRRKYKTTGRKRLTLGEVTLALKKAYGKAPDRDVYETLVEAFGGKPLYETTALVYLIDAKTGEPPVATASTRQSKLDDNSRKTGREVALGRLLRSTNNPPFNPFERAAIKTAYENRLKTTKKSPPPSGAGSAPIGQVRSTHLDAIGHTTVNKIINFPERTLQMRARAA